MKSRIRVTKQSQSEYYDENKKSADKIQGISEGNLLMIFQRHLLNPLENQVAAHKPIDLKTAMEKARLLEIFECEDQKDTFSASSAFFEEELLKKIYGIQCQFFEVQIFFRKQDQELEELRWCSTDATG